MSPERREDYMFDSAGNAVIRKISEAGKIVHRNKITINGEMQNGSDPHSTFDYYILRKKTPNFKARDKKSINIVDLFCGCGGLTLGIFEACKAINIGCNVLIALDNDIDSLEVYKQNFNPRMTFCKDICSIINGNFNDSLTKEEKDLSKNMDKIDLLLAGPPCQGHSDLNNHTRRNDKRNGLYEKVGRFAEIMRPTSIIIENVPAVMNDRKKSIQKTSNFLESLGYRVSMEVVDLASIGVPQKRKRHILVASLKKIVDIPGIIQKFRVDDIRTVEWAIKDLENRKNGSIFDRPSKHTDENKRRIQYLFNKKLYNLPDSMRPPCHREKDHTYKAMYGRLRYDQPAQTITSGFVSPGQGRFIHPAQPRTITPHEAARLQLFSDFFDFSSARSRTALADMIGNAVPMKLSYILGLELIG